MWDSSGGGSGCLKVLAPLEGLSRVGDASDGVLVRRFPRRGLDSSLLASFLWFLAISELVS